MTYHCTEKDNNDGVRNHHSVGWIHGNTRKCVLQKPREFQLSMHYTPISRTINPTGLYDS